ncbi:MULTISPECIES: MOSC domain-containing protein [unclassified Corallococcus]|uniref:MOSC domain-containing protein n=1 Tax=unclassified Corallococcus TaxID=2685029 RepID=UPI0022A8D5AA|nr:MOSC domain-containing protein [Corallococcus sp. NCRR]WAS86005.1 MOSC domain-containing protein [Corallococcus sp. NCRR]
MSTAGIIKALFLAQERGTPMRRVPEARAVEQHGFEGDRHQRRAVGHKRQLLLMDEAQRQSLDVPGGALKENVLVEGLPLDALPPGQRLALGGEVVVELTEPCVPCWKLDALRPGLLKDSWGRRGQLARVLKAGTVHEGDTVRLLDVNPDAPRIIRPRLP